MRAVQKVAETVPETPYPPLFFSPHPATTKPVDNSNPPAQESQLVLIFFTSFGMMLHLLQDKFCKRRAIGSISLTH